MPLLPLVGPDEKRVGWGGVEWGVEQTQNWFALTWYMQLSPSAYLHFVQFLDFGAWIHPC